jgi:RNA-directed DNA polymerase
MAVRDVTKNKGKNTPGHDGKVWKTPAEKFNAIEALRNVVIGKNNSYRSNVIKRVWIPKGNKGDLRPLGIPVILDRALQALVKSALDPIAEEVSDAHSYGFRKFKSTHDAINRIRHILHKPWGPRWVWDADISKCFDEIDHEYLLTLVKPMLCRKGSWMIEQWLKAPIRDKRRTVRPTKGTPQGGVISPLLCNIVLNGLEKEVRGEYVKSYHKDLRGLWVVRYADDIVVTCLSKEQLKNEVIPKIKTFLKHRGLKISEEKSKIVNVEDKSFEFLGWEISRKPLNWRRNTFKTTDSTIVIVRPSREALKRVKLAVREKFKRMSVTIDGIIRDVNPILIGWCNYYRSSYHSMDDFSTLHNYVYYTFWRWAAKNNRNLNRRQIVRRFFVGTAKRKWTISGDTKGVNLYDATLTKIVKLTSQKTGLNPYTDEDYFISRAKIFEADGFRLRVYRKWKWKCALCNGPLHGSEPIEMHHLVPKKDGGAYDLKNIVPVHKTCHDSITYGNKMIPANTEVENK